MWPKLGSLPCGEIPLKSRRWTIEVTVASTSLLCLGLDFSLWDISQGLLDFEATGDITEGMAYLCFLTFGYEQTIKGYPNKMPNKINYYFPKFLTNIVVSMEQHIDQFFYIEDQYVVISVDLG